MMGQAFGWGLVVIVGLWVLVYLLPDVIFHHLQWGAYFGSRHDPRLGLTFDDGPGLDTPDILTVLESLGVTATFFIVTARAQEYPEVVQRMVDHHMEIGLHMTEHVSAYLLWPWQSFSLVQRGLHDIESLTGRRPSFIRPPWGHVNLGTWMAIRRFKLTPVFWDIAPDDWREDHSSEFISHYVTQLAQPGAVVVLHDAGGSRQRTCAALKPMIEGVRALGLEPSAVGVIGRDASWLRRLWSWWELRFTRAWHIESIPNRAGGEPFLRIGRARYRGPRITLDGLVVESGDAMGEIHFGNPALSQTQSSLRAYHGVMMALRDLADWLKAHEEYRDIRVVGGITLLDAAHAIDKLGFHHVPVRGWQKWSMWIYLTVLMAIYHRDGWRTLKRFFDLRPVLIVMSRDDLYNRYLNKPRPLKKG